MANLIADKVKEVHVLEGAEELIIQAKQESKANIKFIHTLFENFTSKQKYDYVFALYVLEHVLDVPAILNMIKKNS